MKKVRSLLLSLLLLLSGCASEPETLDIVTAAAVDPAPGGVAVTLEILSAERSESDALSRFLVEGTGTDVRSAIFDASDATGGTLDFDACEVLILCDRLPKAMTSDALSCFYSGGKNAPTAFLLAADNGRDVLQAQPIGEENCAFFLKKKLLLADCPRLWQAMRAILDEKDCVLPFVFLSNDSPQLDPARFTLSRTLSRPLVQAMTDPKEEQSND